MQATGWTGRWKASSPARRPPRLPLPLYVQLQFDIIKEVAINIKCLIDHGYYYTDLKTENILYKIFDNKLKIYFGDLGSICNSNNKKSECQWASTYGPLNYNLKEFIQNEETVIWQLGIFILELFPHTNKLVSVRRGDTNKPYQFIYTADFVKELRLSRIKEKIQAIKNKMRTARGVDDEIDKFYENIRKGLVVINKYKEIEGITCGGKKYDLCTFILKLFEKPGESFTLNEIMKIKTDIRIIPEQ